MAQMNLYTSILLALIMLQCINPSEGRHSKLIRQREFRKVPYRRTIFEEDMQKKADQNSNLHGESTNQAAYADGFLPTSPKLPTASSPSVDESTQPSPPGHIDSFRPTTPGRSPGIGHFLQN
ncbi:hypothetical protein NMG60_11026080 [Bertholletia excelsa]